MKKQKGVLIVGILIVVGVSSFRFYNRVLIY